MSIKLDCRGMSCPAPVLHVRNYLTENKPNIITVIVDNDAARQNVGRFLEHQGYMSSYVVQDDESLVIGTRSEASFPTSGLFSAVPVIAAESTTHGGKKIMVLVTSTHMGHGDDGLGDMLMFNYLKTLKEMGGDLWHLAFVNSGVSFTAEGSDAVPVLQELLESGVHISACGACLAYFHILDKIQVGEVTNMFEIVTNMKLADSVITI